MPNPLACALPAGRPALPAVVAQLHSEQPASRAMTLTLEDRLGQLFKIFRGEPSGMMLFAVAKMGACVARGVLTGIFDGEQPGLNAQIESCRDEHGCLGMLCQLRQSPLDSLSISWLCG